MQLLEEQPLQLTPGVERLMKSLQNAGVNIRLVSGGFRIMIEPVADILNMPHTNIVANMLLFSDSDEDSGATMSQLRPLRDSDDRAYCWTTIVVTQSQSKC